MLIFGGRILSYSLLIINNGVMPFVWGVPWGDHEQFTTFISLKCKKKKSSQIHPKYRRISLKQSREERPELFIKQVNALPWKKSWG